ncbi:AAA domain-containing protein [Acrocarpospora sp. B8E8]|uniref:AAA domain-containing protein n=1 Tax=Acrocarpospora sp. B8E8 TaxID=3153572 RepID=UPI00325CD91B
MVDLIHKAAEKWADSLVELGGNNPLLYFKPSATSGLDLADADVAALTALFGNRPTLLSALFKDPARHDVMGTRAQLLRKRILTFEEEQGIAVGHLVRGLIHVVPHSRRGRITPLRAPLLLQNFALLARTESDFTLKLSDEVVVNPTLMYALDRLFGVDPGDLEEKIDGLLAEAAHHEDQVEQVYRMLQEALQLHGHSTRLESLLLAGVFSYDKLPMVEELRTCGQLMARHPVIAALAGDPDATSTLLGEPAPEQVSSDTIRPENEFLICDADSSQQQAISRALAGRHLLIDGPPGTGKSQTIANIIASMAAHGRRVLFVAEKRAAIEAVTDRLAAAGLDRLVFDLHDRRVQQQKIAKQIQQALEGAEREPPVEAAESHARLERRRAAAMLHDVEIHGRREPWGISFYQAVDRLLALPSELTSDIRLAVAALRTVNLSVLNELQDDLRRYVNQGGHQIRLGESLWSRSQVRDREALRTLLHRLDRLSPASVLELHAGVRVLAGSAGLQEPGTLGEWSELLHLLEGVTRTLTVFGSEIFDEDLVDLHYATADRRWRAQRPRPMGLWPLILLRWRAMRLAVNGPRRRKALHAQLTAALDQREHWFTRSEGRTLPADLAGRVPEAERFATFLDDLKAVAEHTALVRFEDRHTPAEVAATMAKLHAERATLNRMPEHNQITDRFHALGLGQLLDKLADRNTGADASADILQRVWLTSLLDEMRQESDHLRSFSGKTHSEVITHFQRADREHVHMTAGRVKRKVAERIRQVGDSNREQSKIVLEQASRSRGHMPLRRLIEKAPDVLLATFPCWAMSPIVVSRMLPAQRLFDMVIFDEASQIAPPDAITSIMRGAQVIVAGDEHQLPPSDYFKRTLSESVDTDDTDDDLTDYESILTRLGALIRTRTRLSWHYRSRDERLIAFSNVEIYDKALTTFPGVQPEPPIRFEHVPDAVAIPGQSGSSFEEVKRVVDLVLHHAEYQKDLTMGVITLGRPHADRIEKALHEAQRGRPDLAEFFAAGKGPGSRFFVKNLETVQGDERDVIILSLGYARAKNHVLTYQFGVLNRADGHRRLNVAITRARRRLTVVSAFHPDDMDPGRTRSARHSGVELLRRFLVFAARDGEIERAGSGDQKLNGFERSVLNALERENLPVQAQYGCGGYRVDFALSHPERPGRMVLAVEADGERYHKSASARDRDRLRQAHLEALGWRFHRLWSAEWLRDPDGQTAAIVQAWRHAVATSDAPPQTSESDVESDPEPPDPRARRGRRPYVEYRRNIGEYPEHELVALSVWVLRDALQIRREDRVREVARELGFQRVGSAIRTRLEAALNRAQQIIDDQGGG